MKLFSSVLFGLCLEGLHVVKAGGGGGGGEASISRDAFSSDARKGYHGGSGVQIVRVEVVVLTVHMVVAVVGPVVMVQWLYR